jgi:hypothetical protein
LRKILIRFIEKSMKPLLLFLIVTAIFLNVSKAAFAVVVPSVGTTKKPLVQGHKNIATMKLKEFQQLVGRKLTFKEKVGFIVLKHKMKRHSKDADSQGLLPFILGLSGIGLLVICLLYTFSEPTRPEE